MKKLSVLALVAILFFACGGGNKSKILGEWKIADMSAPLPSGLPDSLKTQYAEMLKKQVEAIKASSTFTYKDDGSYTYNFAGKIGAGNWKLNDQSTEITLTEGGKSDVSKIVELSENKLVMQSAQPDGTGNLTLTLAR
jgi:hypothetical protein